MPCLVNTNFWIPVGVPFFGFSFISGREQRGRSCLVSCEDTSTLDGSPALTTQPLLTGTVSQYYQGREDCSLAGEGKHKHSILHTHCIILWHMATALEEQHLYNEWCWVNKCPWRKHSSLIHMSHHTQKQSQVDYRSKCRKQTAETQKKEQPWLGTTDVQGCRMNEPTEGVMDRVRNSNT